MLHFYLVKKIGDGTRENPFRPDFNGSYVWGPDNICPHCETYIIGLAKESETLTPITDLESACIARDLAIGDVANWFVGD